MTSKVHLALTRLTMVFSSVSNDGEDARMCITLNCKYSEGDYSHYSLTASMLSQNQSSDFIVILCSYTVFSQQVLKVSISMNQSKLSLCSVTYAYILRLKQSLTLLEISYAQFTEHGITCTLNILNIHYNNSDLYKFCKQK
jgi:hypothetical protein